MTRTVGEQQLFNSNNFNSDLQYNEITYSVFCNPRQLIVHIRSIHEVFCDTIQIN